MTDAYFQKLDELIEFFKNEEELSIRRFNLVHENAKFHLTIILPIFAAMIAFFLSIPALAGSSSIISIYSAIAAGGLAIGSLFTYRRYTKVSTDFFEDYYVGMSIPFYVVISFLLWLKVLDRQLDLSPILREIEPFQIRDKRWFDRLLKSIEEVRAEYVNQKKSSSG